MNDSINGIASEIPYISLGVRDHLPLIRTALESLAISSFTIPGFRIPSESSIVKGFCKIDRR